MTAFLNLLLRINIFCVSYGGALEQTLESPGTPFISAWVSAIIQVPIFAYIGFWMLKWRDREKYKNALNL